MLYISSILLTKRGRLGGASGEKKQRDWPVDAQQRVLIAGLVGEWQSLLWHNRREGVVLCDKYDRMNGLYFKGLIEREFARTFRDSNKGGSKLFVQDGEQSVHLIFYLLVQRYRYFLPMKVNLTRTL